MGTPHTVFSAFWAAPATPRAPEGQNEADDLGGRGLMSDHGHRFRRAPGVIPVFPNAQQEDQSSASSCLDELCRATTRTRVLSWFFCDRQGALQYSLIRPWTACLRLIWAVTSIAWPGSYSGGRCEYLVERTRELAVTVPDQEFEVASAITEFHEQVAGLLGGPRS
jgi:hypothetical protein